MATLNDKTVGDIVQLNVGSVATNFLVVHKGLPSTKYDSSCDGVWLLMVNAYGSSMKWDSTNNDYENSDVHSYLNSTFFNLLDDDVKNSIKQVKIPYRKGSGTSTTVSSGSSGLSTKIFLLSRFELGWTAYLADANDGDKLTYFTASSALLNALRICYSPDGTARTWWTRTPDVETGDGYIHCVYTSGVQSVNRCTGRNYVRPAMILPYDFALGGSKSITGSVNINGVQRELTGDGYINIGGVLRDLSDSQSNIGGTLKSMKG